MLEGLEGLERSLRDAGQKGGNCENTYLRFRPSEGLNNLKARRRETRDAQLRKSLTFTIRKNHRQEVRVWKIERLNAQLGHAKNWRTLRSMPFATKGFRQQQTPQPNTFADMSGQIFVGNPDRPCRPANLTENPWPMHVLQCAVGRMKIHKGAEAGLVAELLTIRLMFSKLTYCVCSMIFSTLEIFHHVGTGLVFRSWRRRRGLNNHLISGPLQTSVCCIKHLPS